VSRIRRELGVRVGIRAVFDTPTVAGMAARLGEGDGDPLAVLLPLRSTGTRPPLFCVAPAAGISWVYSGLLRHVPDRPVYGLQSPGLSEQGWSGDLMELVKDYLDELRTVQPEGPYHLVGWSFGGQVAHAMAARLQAEGEDVALLAILDGYPGTDATPPDRDDLADLLTSLGRDSLTDLVPILGERAVDALPNVFAHNRTLSNTPHPTDPFHGDALFFLATQGRTESSPTPEAWHAHVTGRVEVHEIPCPHGEMTGREPIARIGAILAERLR
jgi:thioesterase domain-containing protein